MIIVVTCAMEIKPVMMNAWSTTNLEITPDDSIITVATMTIWGGGGGHGFCAGALISPIWVTRPQYTPTVYQSNFKSVGNKSIGNDDWH